MEAALPLAFAFVLAVISLFSEKLVDKFEKYHEELMSLSAGILITIILTSFLGIISSGASLFGKAIYIYLVLGFVIFHSAEKYVYKHVPSDRIKSLRKQLGMLHLAGYTVDHIILGIFLVMAWFLQSVSTLYILIAPFVIHIIASSHPLKHVGKITHKVWADMLFAFAIPLGSLAALMLLGFQNALYSVFALVTGTLLYVVVMDIIPKYRKGNLYWFLIGFFLAAAVQMILF